MTLAAFADLAEVVGALGVIAGLVFVGVQLRQNTRQMQRGEANMAMAQGSALRHLMLTDRRASELIFAGVNSEAPLDPVDAMRLNAFFSEIIFMALLVWDRVRNGLAPADELTRGIIPVLTPMLTSPRCLAWWARSRATFRADFVADLEAALPALAPPSATAPQGAVSAVAPTADAG